jgi:hypothetical protein
MLRNNALYDFTFLKEYRPDDGGRTDLWNADKLIPVYMALHLRRRPIYVVTAVRTLNPN